MQRSDETVEDHSYNIMHKPRTHLSQSAVGSLVISSFIHIDFIENLDIVFVVTALVTSNEKFLEFGFALSFYIFVGIEAEIEVAVFGIVSEGDILSGNGLVGGDSCYTYHTEHEVFHHHQNVVEGGGVQPCFDISIGVVFLDNVTAFVFEVGDVVFVTVIVFLNSVISVAVSFSVQYIGSESYPDTADKRAYHTFFIAFFVNFRVGPMFFSRSNVKRNVEYAGIVSVSFHGSYGTASVARSGFDSRSVASDNQVEVLVNFAPELEDIGTASGSLEG